MTEHLHDPPTEWRRNATPAHHDLRDFFGGLGFLQFRMSQVNFQLANPVERPQLHMMSHRQITGFHVSLRGLQFRPILPALKFHQDIPFVKAFPITKGDFFNLSLQFT